MRVEKTRLTSSADIDATRRACQARLRQDMPLFSTGAGVWEGTYRYLDENGQIIDQHRSRLIGRFPDEGAFPYIQTNIYMWEDGHTERRNFPVTYQGGGRLIYENDLISGYFMEVAEDDDHRTILGHWRRHDLDRISFYEMIQRSPCGRYRTRTWQWLRDGGGVYRRTIIDEQKVSEDWREYSDDLAGL